MSVDGIIVSKTASSTGQLKITSLSVTNTVDPGGWADDNSSQVSRRTATALFASLARVPSLTKVRLAGLPIGYPPIRSFRTQQSGSRAGSDLPIGLGCFTRGSASPVVSRETMREEIYETVADMTAEDQQRNRVEPQGLVLPLQCLEIEGLDFGVRASKIRGVLHTSVAETG